MDADAQRELDIDAMLATRPAPATERQTRSTTRPGFVNMGGAWVSRSVMDEIRSQVRPVRPDPEPEVLEPFPPAPAQFVQRGLILDMSPQEFARLLRDIAVGAAKKATDALRAELADQPAMRFKGAWSVASVYVAGDVVQRSGGLFIALIGTNESPGASEAWRRLAASA